MNSVLRTKKILRIKLPQGDVCATHNGTVERFETTLELECDQREQFIKIMNNGDFDQTRCKNVVKIRTQAGKSIKIIK